jgi:hypothetical protein
MLLLFLVVLPCCLHAQSRPDVLIARQPDPGSCCYELRLENRHTPQSPLDQLQLRVITAGVFFQDGATGPWPEVTSDTLILFGDGGDQLPVNEAMDGFIICVNLPSNWTGAFKIEWITIFNNAAVTTDTLTLVCSSTPDSSDSLRVSSVAPPNQPYETCCYDLTLLNRNSAASNVNSLTLRLMTPGATFSGPQSGPWSHSQPNATTIEFTYDSAPLGPGGTLDGFRICVRPPDATAGNVLMQWITTYNGNPVSDGSHILACSPKLEPRCDSIAMRRSSNCVYSLSVFNKHVPQSGLDGVRISVLTPGASIESASAPIGWNITSQTGVFLTFRRIAGPMTPGDSVSGFLLAFKPSASGLVRFSVCTMLQSSTICCDSLQVQCDPPQPSTCDSLLTSRTGSGCRYDFGFINQQTPESPVSDFHIRVQSPGAAILSAVAPANWYIHRQTATEIEFRDTTSSVLPGGKQTGFILQFQQPAVGNTIVYQWCTGLGGNILCCEYDAVNCDVIQPRCDSLSVAPAGDYCSWRFDLSNQHIPVSGITSFRLMLRDSESTLLNAAAPPGWEIDSLSERSVVFRIEDEDLASGETAEGFILDLAPGALSNRILLEWCTWQDDRMICCDTVSVFCDFNLLVPDRVDVITSTERPCCFEFEIENSHIPRSAITSFTAEITTPGVHLYSSTIGSPSEWSAVSSDRKVTWRTTTRALESGEILGGFIVCYDNDATANADFELLWQTISSGLIITQNTLTIKCDRTLAVSLFDDGIPAQLSLHQNYPNPFNPTTSIQFDLPDERHVDLLLFDAHGRAVMEIVNGRYAAGSWRVDVDASSLPSGMYFYQLRSGGQLLTRSMLLLR